jgi:hypothetical protein
MGSDDQPGARIADAVEGLRDRAIAVPAATSAGTTTYVVERPTYRVTIVVNPARWLGLDFHLFGPDGSTVLTYAVDTDLYNISLSRYQRFAADIETDIVLLLEALAQGKVLVDRSGPRPSMIVSTGRGQVWVRKRRLGTTVTPWQAATESAVPPGFGRLAP